MRFYHAAFLVAGLASAAAAPGAPDDAPADAASLRGARHLQDGVSQPGTENPGFGGCPEGEAPLDFTFEPDYSSDNGYPYFALHNMCADGYPEVAHLLLSKGGIINSVRPFKQSFDLCVPRDWSFKYMVKIKNMEVTLRRALTNGDTIGGECPQSAGGK